MPRTNGVYTPPAGTKGVPDTTIRSAPYNALVDDLTADANAARPISAGGTGATNATAARENIGAIGADDLKNADTKTTPVDADAVVITDSADSGKTKRVLWSRVKAVLNSLYLRTDASGETTGTLTASTLQIKNAAVSVLRFLRGNSSRAGSVYIDNATGSLFVVIDNPDNTSTKLWEFKQSGELSSPNAPTLANSLTRKDYVDAGDSANASAASSAQSTANTAVSKADTAQSTANTAVSNAAAAQSTANTAVSKADAAQSTAEVRLIRDGASHAGFVGGIKTRPYFRASADNSINELQPALGFTPTRQLSSNTIGFAWTSGQPFINIDNGGANLQLVTHSNLSAWMNNFSVAYKDQSVTFGYGAGQGSGQVGIISNLNSSGTGISIRDRGAEKGAGVMSTTAVQWTTSSDYRLKQDISSLVEFTLTEDQFGSLSEALLRVMTFRPVRHSWIAEPETYTHGFIAHELQAPAPHAVAGVKDGIEEIGTATIAGAVTPGYTTEVEDGVDEDGNPVTKTIDVPETREPDTIIENVLQSDFPNAKSWVKSGERPKYQGVDTSKLVADLTAAVQSLTLMVLEQDRQIKDLQTNQAA